MRPRQSLCTALALDLNRVRIAEIEPVLANTAVRVLW